MQYKIKISILAEQDLTNIFFNIKYTFNEPIIANKYVAHIKQKLLTLQYIPKKYSLLNNELLKSKGFRKLVIKNYIAFYKINEKEKIVNIERVIYGGYNWEYKI